MKICSEVGPQFVPSVGYYYQYGDLGTADGSGVLGRLAYEMTSGLTAGVNISYDQAFDTRVSADIKIRFGGSKATEKRKEVQSLPVISSLMSSPGNRDVRVHDSCRRESIGVTSDKCARQRELDSFLKEKCGEAKGPYAEDYDYKVIGDKTLRDLLCKNKPAYPTNIIEV